MGEALKTYSRTTGNWEAAAAEVGWGRPAAAAKSLQSCPTLRDPMDCSLPGSSAHEIFRQEYCSGGRPRAS